MCDQCNIARDFANYRMFNPGCLYCGARIIQRLALFQISDSECFARRKAMLKVWLDMGHSERAIRTLVKGPLALGPEKATECASPSRRKSR